MNDIINWVGKMVFSSAISLWFYGGNEAFNIRIPASQPACIINTFQLYNRVYVKENIKWYGASVPAPKMGCKYHQCRNIKNTENEFFLFSLLATDCGNGLLYRS